MRFTDDDLKRWKGHIANTEQATDYAIPQFMLPCGLGKALIARLEAAEAWCSWRYEHMDPDYCHSKENELAEAWRKAAGK